MRSTDYDVVHAHLPLPSGILAYWLKRTARIPYVVSVHGSDVPGINPDRFRIAHLFTPPFLRRIGGSASRIVAMSDYLGNLMRTEIHDFPAQHVIRIPNGIDTTSFEPAGKSKIILSTGRLLPRKGFQHLISAVSTFDLGYELHICGDGPLRDSLERDAKRSHTLVIFHGWVDNRSELYRHLLSRAAIFVLASEKENCSVSLLEALSAGCAIVTTNVNGCREAIGDAGLLVAPGDVEGIREAITTLVDDEDQRTTLQLRRACQICR